MRFTIPALCVALLSLSATACLDDTDGTLEPEKPGDPTVDPGALIDISMQSRVGVLLDELSGSTRERAAQAYLAKPADFWKARAHQQVTATLYRLIYRNYYHANKGQLPLPPEELWSFTVGTPRRATVDGHDLVLVDYTFSSTLLTDVISPGEADKALASIGGSVDEGFVLPVDPEMLFQRTGYACMDEEEFPPNSVDSENALAFYDQDCKGGETACHVSLPAPKESCVDALKTYVGRVSTSMRFTRAAWSAARADAVRRGAPSSGGANLQVLTSGLEDNRLIYRYIPADSCAIVEGCVSGSGWRRLLQFSASVYNVGNGPVHIGNVSSSAEVVQHNMFEYSACHGHMHFSHYGRFTYQTGDEALGSKRAFCLESTSRYGNNELAPLTHPYSCQFQGIETGWGDDYIAGLDCQWIDVTTVDTSAGPVTAPLVFDANPDGFLCEGVPATSSSGGFQFEPTEFTTETGLPVDRIACNEAPGWELGNQGSTPVTLAKEGSFVSAPCDRGQLGPKRDCGFQEQIDTLTCTPGTPVKLSCQVSNAAAPQALRVCETSAVLGTGLACAYHESLANVTLADKAVNVTFTCPAARDALEPGGKYAFFTAPILEGDSRQAVTCQPR